MTGEQPKTRPAKLYRYYGNIDHALDVVTNNRFYAICPLQFNDPFDCRIPVSFKATNAEMERKFWEIVANEGTPKQIAKAKLRSLRATKFEVFRRAGMQQ